MEGKPQVVEMTALEIINKSEIDMQISTARKYPRSIEAFKNKATELATSDRSIAESCFYALSRGGKTIEGPSVRLAEIVASSWGNLRSGARIVGETEKEVIAQGIAHDLESNTSYNVEVTRSIKTKEGRRYSDDMIAVTKNAACSIALRNAIFKAVPFIYAKQIYEKAVKTATGDLTTIKERKGHILGIFKEIGVTEKMILEKMNKPSMEDIGLGDMKVLFGIFNAINDSDTTVEEQFRKKAAPSTGRQKAEPEKSKGKPDDRPKDKKPAKEQPDESDNDDAPPVGDTFLDEK